MDKQTEQHIDLGAQVGIMRNREFAAGGRAHRISAGSYSSARPTFDPKSGRMHVSTASDTGDPSVGRLSPTGKDQAMPEHVSGVGSVNDGTTGDTSPERRRDTDTI